MQSLSPLLTTTPRGFSPLDAFDHAGGSDFGFASSSSPGSHESSFKDALTDAVESPDRSQRSTSDDEPSLAEKAEKADKARDDAADADKSVEPEASDDDRDTAIEATDSTEETQTTDEPAQEAVVAAIALQTQQNAEQGRSEAIARSNTDAQIRSEAAQTAQQAAADGAQYAAQQRTDAQTKTDGQTVQTDQATATTETSAADDSIRVGQLVGEAGADAKSAKTAVQANTQTTGDGEARQAVSDATGQSSAHRQNSGGESDGQRRDDAAQRAHQKAQESQANQRRQDAQQVATTADRGTEAPKTTEQTQNAQAATSSALEQMIDQAKGERRGSMNQVDPAVLRAERVDAAIRQQQGIPSAASLSGTALTDVDATLSMATTAPTAVGADSLADKLGATTTATSAGRAAMMDAADDDRFTSRVLRGMNALMNQRGGVMNMRLDPPELGQMRVQMVIAQGTVSAVFQAMDPTAQSLLERNLASLRTSLESQGLQVDKLSVQASTTSSSSQTSTAQDQSNQQQDGAQQRNDADAGRGQSRGRQDGDGSASQSSSHESTSAGQDASPFQAALQEIGADAESPEAPAALRGGSS